MAARKKKATKAPWERKAPRKKKAGKRLSAAQKSRAKKRAKKAGRKYPNLVDNMREASRKR